MKLIVGLGNPEKKYFKTRHNVGRVLIERIAAQEKASFRFLKKEQAYFAQCQWRGESVTLAYTDTYMNTSGEAVLKLSQSLAVDVSRDLLIVVDDVAIPFGTFRLRAQGSDGGHNGLKSVSSGLGMTGYARLRFGIGNPVSLKSTETSLEVFVLTSFDRNEKKELPALMERGIQACHLWVLEPIDRAMNSINHSIV